VEWLISDFVALSENAAVPVGFQMCIHTGMVFGML
jgi:hypothetical protein